MRISLYSTRDSAIPALLSSFTLEEDIERIALGDQYLVLVTSARDELLVYVPGGADLSLERRAVAAKGDLFEDIYALKVRLEEV